MCIYGEGIFLIDGWPEEIRSGSIFSFFGCFRQYMFHPLNYVVIDTLHPLSKILR